MLVLVKGIWKGLDSPFAYALDNRRNPKLWILWEGRHCLPLSGQALESKRASQQLHTSFFVKSKPKCF